jgi:RimJ/RimL family protein N-acetyltransferase
VVVLRDFIANDTESFTENDMQRLVTVLNDESVTQYLSTKIPSPYTQEDARLWIEEGSNSPLVKAICFNGVLVGFIGVNRGEFEYQKSGEIGITQEAVLKNAIFKNDQFYDNHIFAKLK